MQVVIKSENKDEFKSMVDELTAREFSVLETRTPGCFFHEKQDSIPGISLFIVMLLGITLGVVLVVLINSVWFHQVGNKPQNLGGVIGWLPVIFEVTILVTTIFYLTRFIKEISKQRIEFPIATNPMHYYCFLELKSENEKEYLFTNYKKNQIIEC